MECSIKAPSTSSLLASIVPGPSLAVVVVVARHRHSTIAVLELDAFAHSQDTVLRHTFQTPSKSRLLSSQVRGFDFAGVIGPSGSR